MDKYIIKDTYILCLSNSGKQYYITDNACTCPGWGFRRKCRHADYVRENKLLEKLKPKQDMCAINFSSPFIKMERMKALIWFLKKNGIKPTKGIILKIEPRITVNTKPENVIMVAHKLLSKGV